MYPKPYAARAFPLSLAARNNARAVSLLGSLTPTPLANIWPKCAIASASPAAAACVKYLYAVRASCLTPREPNVSNRPTALAASALPMSAEYL